MTFALWLADCARVQPPSASAPQPWTSQPPQLLVALTQPQLELVSFPAHTQISGLRKCELAGAEVVHAG